MPREVFHRKRPVCLSVTARNDADRSLVEAFKQMCDAQGLSVQQGLLRAARDYLSSLEIGS